MKLLKAIGYGIALCWLFVSDLLFVAPVYLTIRLLNYILYKQNLKDNLKNHADQNKTTKQ